MIYSSPRPDGFSGALLACESIRDAAVILHGPTGCRGLHATLSARFYPRPAVERPNYSEDFYFGQPRIPTTYLDGDDFIFGAKEKLIQAIAMAAKRDAAILAVVNSPGAALIGDDLRRCAAEGAPSIPCATIETPMLSLPFAQGYQQGLISILEAQAPAPQKPRPRTAILIGLSIAHQRWWGSIEEVRRLLALCGVDVLCTIGAGSSVAEHMRIPEASCYAVLHEEYADRVGPWLQRRYGGVVAAGEAGAPVGFSATISWISAIAHALDVDPAPAINDIRNQRRRVSRLIAQASAFTEALKGATFAIQADPSFALPLAGWLFEYLGMLPVSIETPDFSTTDAAAKLEGWLSSIGCHDAWQRSWRQTDPTILFADGLEALHARSSDWCGSVEVAFPSGQIIDIVPKAMLGGMGGAWLVESILKETSWIL